MEWQTQLRRMAFAGTTPMTPPPWTPDQKLRHDATDGQIVDRMLALPVSGRLVRQILVARELAAACVAEERRVQKLGRALEISRGMSR